MPPSPREGDRGDGNGPDGSNRGYGLGNLHGDPGLRQDERGGLEPDADARSAGDGWQEGPAGAAAAAAHRAGQGAASGNRSDQPQLLDVAARRSEDFDQPAPA